MGIIIKKVLEFFIGLMGRNLKDFGKKENNMVLGIFLLIKLVNMENGMKENMLKLWMIKVKKIILKNILKGLKLKMNILSLFKIYKIWKGNWNWK